MPHCTRIQTGDLVKVKLAGGMLALVLHEYSHKPWVTLRFLSGARPQLYDAQDLTLVSKTVD
jgi:hypothetical protein